MAERSEKENSNIKSEENCKNKLIYKVLMIYTGGTIGMQKKRVAGSKNCVYEPVKNHFKEEMKKIPKLHDDRYDTESSTKQKKEDWLVTKESEDGKRIQYFFKEYDPLLDSSNMDMDDWVYIASDIKDNYNDYDGFVVLHGTDTMAYGASALSFIFECLDKSVVVTGSQIPIGELRSDAPDNILSSLIVAAFTHIPEVMICFGGQVLRGNRTIKYDAGSLSPFISPNFDPLVKFGVKVTVKKVEPCYTNGTLVVNKSMSSNVTVLPVYPGITAEIVDSLVNSLKTPAGMVLQTFGAGNAPNRKRNPNVHNSKRYLLDALREASEKDIIIVNITQCARGSVDASYAVGQALADNGVIQGGDMTPETALAKLSYVLEKYKSNKETIKQKMKENLRGELTVTQKSDHLSTNC